MFLLINLFLIHLETSSVVVLQNSCCFTLLESSELDVASVTATCLLTDIIFCLAYKYFLNSSKYFFPLKFGTFTLDFVPSSDQVGKS